MHSALFAAVVALPGAVLGQAVYLIEDPSPVPFVDIAGIGELLPLAGDEEIDIGTFPGNFVILAGTMTVAQNGGMSFGQTTVSDLAPINQQIPSLDAFLGGQAALAFWDDIDDKEGDTYFVELVGDPVLGSRLVVQWNHGNFDGLGSTLKFQVHILPNDEPTGTYAQYIYKIEGPAAAAGVSATIGYQDGDAGFGYMQFSFNQAGAVTDGTVLSLIIPETADLDADGLIGSTDSLALLPAWGRCDAGPTGPADLDGDCNVGILDMLELLSNWS